VTDFDSVIPPGGQGQIVAGIKTKGIQGRRSKNIAVQTNDPEQPNIRLRVSFEVVPPVIVGPQNVVTLTAIQGAPAQATLWLRRSDGTPLEVLSAQADREGVEVTFEKVSADDQDAGKDARSARAGDWRIEVALSDTTAARNDAGKVTIETNHPDRKLIRVPLRIRVRPLLQATPSRVSMRYAIGGEPAQSSFVLRHGKGRKFIVQDIEIAELAGGGTVAGKTSSPVTGSPGLPGLEVHGGGDQPAVSHRLEVSFRGTEIQEGVHRAKIVVKTNLKKAPRIEIPLILRIDGRAD